MQVRFAWRRLKEKMQEIGEMAQATAGDDVDDYCHAAIHRKVTKLLRISMLKDYYIINYLM